MTQPNLIKGAPGLPGAIPPTISARQAATILGVGYRTFRKAYEAAGGRYLRLGTQVRRIPVDDLERFYEAHIETPYRGAACDGR